MVRCTLNELWLNATNLDVVLGGHWLTGHDYQPTGETHADHWELKCQSCGRTAASEVNPNSQGESKSHE